MENKAKVKAEELYDKFRSKFFGPSYKLLSIQCALICVEEIITAIDWHDFETPNKELAFWQEVKEHLNAMK